MDYESDLYYEESGGSEAPPKTAAKKAPRNLEDRVREYTGYIQVGSESTWNSSR